MVASFPGLPRFFCSSVPLTIIHGCGRAAKKRGRPGTIHHVSDVGGRKGGRRAGPEGCSSSSRLGSNPPWLVETLIRSTQLRRRFLNLFAVGPHPPTST